MSNISGKTLLSWGSMMAGEMKWHKGKKPKTVSPANEIA